MNELTLADCDGKRIALLIKHGDGNARVIRGEGRWMSDQLLGDSLRICVDENAQTAIFIANSQWSGRITDGSNFGCERCLTIG